jgi:hypothetical protein
MPFGKYKGEPISEIDDEYLEWLIDQDFVREPLRSDLRREWDWRCGYKEYVPPPFEKRVEVVSVPDKLRAAVADIITSGYRASAKKAHPDVGGSGAQMRSLTEAREWLESRLLK